MGVEGGGEFDGGALEDGDLALDADELLVGLGGGGRRSGGCGEGVGFEGLRDGVEACGQVSRCVDGGGCGRADGGDGGDGLGEAAEEGGEGEGGAVEAGRRGRGWR